MAVLCRLYRKLSTMNYGVMDDPAFDGGAEVSEELSDLSSHNCVRSASDLQM